MLYRFIGYANEAAVIPSRHGEKHMDFTKVYLLFEWTASGLWEDLMNLACALLRIDDCTFNIQTQYSKG